ncbi:MAG TPA: ECF transporter S component [Ruminiclostridium sp.]|nr:ECF transporter S component [Ruminiclostridium sp.]
MDTVNLKKTRFIVFTALMAALSFAATYIHIQFSLGGAASSTMVHLGSAACFLAALLLGDLSGGLAGGIGMTLFDVLNGYLMTSPWTLVIKFLTGFAVGKIAWGKGRKGNDQKINLLACIVGGVISLAGYAVCDFVNALITGNSVMAALVTVGSGIVGSILTTVVGILIAIPLNDSVRKALGSSKLLKD